MIECCFDISNSDRRRGYDDPCSACQLKKQVRPFRKTLSAWDVIKKTFWPGR